MADVVIDLGCVGERRVVHEPLPSLPGRRGVLLVAALLLTGLVAGASHRAPPAPPVIVPARLGDITFMTGDRLFVASSGAESHDSAATAKIVYAYALPGGRLISQTSVPAPGPIFGVVEAGPVTLVSYQADLDRKEETVAVRTGSGQVLWQRPIRLLAASAKDGVALLRENSALSGNRNWYGVDLLTGALRWSQKQPVRGFTTEDDYGDGFPRMLISATETGAVEVRDARTGAVTAAATLPIRTDRGGADVPIWPSGDLLMVGSPMGTTAYSLPSLTQRWHSDVDLAGRWMQPGCGGVICSLSWQGGLWVLDPGTGALRWADGRWDYADAVGRYLLATDAPSVARTQVVSVLDLDDGRVLGDFGEWRAIGGPAPDGTVIGLRDGKVNAVWFAKLDPATQSVRVLGLADHVSSDCKTTTEVLICRRIDATVGIWSLQ